MENGAKVKLRGVQIGEVSIHRRANPAQAVDSRSCI